MHRPTIVPEESAAHRLMRRRLLRALGWSAAATFLAQPFAQAASESPPHARPPRTRLPAGKTIYSLRGEVTADGARIHAASQISPGQVIITGPGAELIFVQGDDAYLLRENSQLLLPLAQAGKQLLRLVNGALLAVFGPKDPNAPITVATPHVYMGIRGTGVYVEADADSSYACTCYGMVLLQSVQLPTLQETILSRHHDAPRRITATTISPAPFINHRDVELRLLEALVGRTVPFSLVDDPYQADDYGG